MKGPHRFVYRVFSAWILGLLVGLESPVTAQVEQEYIWEVRNGSTVVFLAGSIHLLRPQDYPLPKIFYQAFQQADRIFFEVDPKEFEDPIVSNYIIQKALYPQNDSLINHLPSETYSNFTHYANMNKLSNLDMLQPWYLNMALGNFELGKSGFTNILAVDQHFYDRSLQETKSVYGLETTQYQIDLFSALSESNQIAALATFLQKPDQVLIDTANLVDAWKRGDAEWIRMYEEQQKEMDPESYNRILVQRNELWLTQITKMLLQTNTTMVIVGASHFIGEKGLINLLRLQGFEVEQLPRLPVVQPEIITFKKINHELAITWQIIPGRSYKLETADIHWEWTTTTTLFATNQLFEWDAPIATDTSSKFFRLRTIP